MILNMNDFTQTRENILANILNYRDNRSFTVGSALDVFMSGTLWFSRSREDSKSDWDWDPARDEGC